MMLFVCCDDQIYVFYANNKRKYLKMRKRMWLPIEFLKQTNVFLLISILQLAALLFPFISILNNWINADAEWIHGEKLGKMSARDSNTSIRSMHG